MAKVQVVFHIDEMEKWGLLLNNVQNLIHGLAGTDSRIEVVANSKAVEFYRAAANTNGTGLALKLAEAGVDFAACGNALRGLKIEPEELLPFIRTVPSGVLELVKRQQAGYAYLKP